MRPRPAMGQPQNAPCRIARRPCYPGTAAIEDAAMDIARVAITLLDVHPLVRRVVDVPLAITLGDLHLIVQAAMGWHNSHLYEFHDGGVIYGIPMPGWSDPDHRPLPADKTALTDVLRAAKLRIGYV